MLRLRLLHVAFGLHIVVEIPAALNFFINPLEELQLATPSASAIALVRQYALLLICSNAIALVFLLLPIDKVSRRVACALGFYHLGPASRAISRLVRNEPALEISLGGPLVHLTVHTLCLVALATGLFSWPPRNRR
ncbi:hypothetical protein V490_02226 [Pseudogymnoascus sp. VKM F-3557]|nr:hypothetical protein V490_02226 [Pseudogymnoascus sp. VKM F-3557]